MFHPESFFFLSIFLQPTQSNMHVYMCRILSLILGINFAAPPMVSLFVSVRAFPTPLSHEATCCE